MTGHTVLVIHSDPQLTSLVATVLHDASFRVLRASDLADAASTFRYFEPDLVLAELGPLRRTSPDTRAMLRGADAGRSIPVLGIAGSGEDQSHLDALGVAGVVSFPFRAEALLASLSEHLGEAPPAGAPAAKGATTTGGDGAAESSGAGMSGQLERFELAELLTMFDMGRRNGRIRLESKGRKAFLELRDGDVVDGGIEGGDTGADVVNELIDWKEGRFEIELVDGADTAPASPAPDISPSDTQDFAVEDRPYLRQLAQSPPEESSATDATAARSGDDVLHEALTLLNAVASYASGFAEKLLLQRKLEAVRRRASASHSALDLFEVSDDATIGLSPRATTEAEAGRVVEDSVVEATAEWLLALSLELDRTFPGSMPKATLRILVESVGDGGDRFGLARALGFGGGDQSWG